MVKEKFKSTAQFYSDLRGPVSWTHGWISASNFHDKNYKRKPGNPIYYIEYEDDVWVPGPAFRGWFSKK